LERVIAAGGVPKSLRGGNRPAFTRRHFLARVDQHRIARVHITPARAMLNGELGKLGPIPDHIHNERSCGFCPFKPICWGAEPPFLPYASLAERATIEAQAAHDADRLVNGMDERRARFLARLNEVNDARFEAA